jgi:hypothetical protein
MGICSSDNRTTVTMLINCNKLRLHNGVLRNLSYAACVQRINAVLISFALFLFFPLMLMAQQPQLSKEYVYLNDRLLATTAGNTDPILMPGGMSSWWAGDENANDLIGSYNATVNGATYAAGKVGNAFNLDGLDDSISIPSMSLGNIFSIELWIYPTSNNNSQNVISNSYNSSSYGALLLDANSRTLYFKQAGWDRVSTGSNSFSSINSWVHIALTHDGFFTRIYVNGVLKGTSGAYRMNFNNSLRLGFSTNGSYGYFKGLIDEVSLYGRALSIEEIQAIYNAGSFGKAKNQFNVYTTALPAMFVGTPVTYQFETKFGTLPVSFTKYSGDLPLGITLNPNGILSGTPTALGNYSFAIKAVDANGLIAMRTISTSVLLGMVPPAGMVSWWPGDATAEDIVANNEGTLANGTIFYPFGKIDKAYWMDGDDDHVQIPSMSIGSSFTIEFWLYPTKNYTDQHLISNSPQSLNYGALYYSAGSNNYVYYKQNNINRVNSGNNTVPLNTWSHIALEHDGNYTRLYVNGVLKGTSSSYEMDFYNAIRIGYRISEDIVGARFGGLIDEVSLHNRALTADEILAIFNSGSNGKSKYQFVINTASLQTIFVNKPVNYQIETLWGTPPISFTLVSGNLPNGLGLGLNGVINGTPTVEGNYSFTIQATDTNGFIASRTISASVLTAMVPPAGIVAWWPGDATAEDIVGNNEGTLVNGTTFYPFGKVDKAFWLDGNDDHVQIPSMSIGSSFTIEFWLYPAKNYTDQHLISNSPQSLNYGAFYYSAGSNNYVYYKQNNINRVNSGTNTVPLNTWSHIALAHDGNYTRLYVNGVLKGTSNSYAMSFNNAIRIGYRITEDIMGTRFGGRIDEVSIYNRPLSDMEILAIFNAGSKGKAKQ